MAKETQRPKVTVETDGEEAQGYRSQGRAARKKADEARDRTYQWLEGAAPGHVNAVIFGLFGLAVALVILFVGFFQAILVAVLVLAGVAFGQWLDGDPKILNGLRRLFRTHDGS